MIASRLVRLVTSAYFLAVLPPLFWAGNAVIGRAVVGQVPPMAMSFWRWALAFLLILPFGLPRLAGQWGKLRRQWRTLLALAASSVAAYNTLLYIAAKTTTAINITLVGTSLPIMVLGLSWLWLGERVGLRQLAGMMVSLVGVLLVIGRGDPGVILGLALFPGDLVMLLATLSWAVYSVMLRRYPTGLEPIPLLTVLMGLGTGLILPFYLWELAVGTTMMVTPGAIASILYVALFPSLVAYYAWNKAVTVLGASLAGQYIYLTPIFAALLAVAFLGESLDWYHVAGLASIVAGISVTTGVPRR